MLFPLSYYCFYSVIITIYDDCDQDRHVWDIDNDYGGGGDDND